jgi:hypothetical protein
MSVDELTPPTGTRAPASWRDVVLQVTQTVVTVGAALTLAILGKVDGNVALAAIIGGGIPAFVRLSKRLRAPTPPAP